MQLTDNLLAREAALLADRARIDEQLVGVRAAIAGARAAVEELAAKAQPEAQPEAEPEA